MKQLFLKTLLWTIQNGGKALVALIRVLTWTPTMIFLLTLNVLNIISGEAVMLNAIAATLLTLALLSKFITHKIETADTRQAEATEARDKAIEALKAEAQEIVATKIVEIDGVPTIVREEISKGGAK